MTAHAARATAKTAATTAKAAVKGVSATVKAMIASVKALVAAIAAGGWVAILAVVIICLIGLIVGSCSFFQFIETSSARWISALSGTTAARL